MSVIDQKVMLNNGKEMPVFGLGVFRSAKEDTAQAVKHAIDQGYRLIDTAAIYENEIEVGLGIAQSNVDRNELFITTKLWLTDFGFHEAFKAHQKSLRKLGLEKVDLYLIHWPMPMHWDKTLAAWKALVEIYNDGLVGSIGVSNFEPEYIERLIDAHSVVPSVNQIELHPYFQQKDLRDYHNHHDIVTQAWSPIGGVDSYGMQGRNRDILNDETIIEIAGVHNKTPAQVILRWHLQHEIAIIPKSVNLNRIIENSQIFDFELDEIDMVEIDGLNMGLRGGLIPYENEKGYGLKISD